MPFSRIGYTNFGLKIYEEDHRKLMFSESFYLQNSYAREQEKLANDFA
ncbi:hypothetical protein PHOSAC3_150089 [Mesotoga infera]|nr:hypothetical protein PHOSAC3_150089 [Mesotoga infera]